MAFEADKLVRIKKEESAMGEVRNQLQTQKASLGEVALGLFRSGALADPQIAALEAKVAEHETHIATIRAEQPKGVEAQPSPAQEVPQAPVAPEAPEAAPRKFCPNCGKPVAPGVAFCAECGAKLGT
jgi:membrane protease subunit (stomatin/prohibitin family)